MPDNETHDPYGYFQDNAGRFYRTPDNKPATTGTPVIISENGQNHEGTFNGGYVDRNKD